MKILAKGKKNGREYVIGQGTYEELQILKYGKNVTAPQLKKRDIADIKNLHKVEKIKSKKMSKKQIKNLHRWAETVKKDKAIYPKGVFKFKTIEEANKFDEKCLAAGIKRDKKKSKKGSKEL